MTARLLLDSHALLWWQGDDARLSARVRATMERADVQLFFSVASIWELAIKQAQKKLDISAILHDVLLEEGFTELSISSIHALAATALPFHHRDPFDRMLVAQAQSEELTLVTSDARIAAYDVSVMW